MTQKNDSALLFTAQRNHGIDARGAAGGDVAGEKGDRQQSGGDGGECEWIGRADFEQQAANQPCARECDDRSHDVANRSLKCPRSRD